MKKLLLFSFLNLLGYFFLYMPHFLRLGFAKLIALLLFLLDKRRKFVLLANLDFAYHNTLSKEQKKERRKEKNTNICYCCCLTVGFVHSLHSGNYVC